MYTFGSGSHRFSKRVPVCRPSPSSPDLATTTPRSRAREWERGGDGKYGSPDRVATGESRSEGAVSEFLRVSPETDKDRAGEQTLGSDGATRATRDDVTDEERTRPLSVESQERFRIPVGDTPVPSWVDDRK